jgi:hypothetical protein
MPYWLNADLSNPSSHQDPLHPESEQDKHIICHKVVASLQLSMGKYYGSSTGICAKKGVVVIRARRWALESDVGVLHISLKMLNRVRQYHGVPKYLNNDRTWIRSAR